MRTVSFAALIVGVMLIPSALGVAKLDHDRDRSEMVRSLVAATDEHGGALDSYFSQARSTVLLTANSPAFAHVLAERGTRAQKVRRGGRNLAELTHHLRYLEQLYPTSIGEACFIDANGEEFARTVRGKIAKVADLSTVEERSVFFAPTFALDFGQVHQTRPYVSADTKEWVVANATLIPQADGHKRAFVHFEVTVESFRRAMGRSSAGEHGFDLRIIDGHTGRVVIDGARPQRVGAAHQEAAVLGRDGLDGVEHELGTGRLGLLMQQWPKLVAGDALRESGKILDPLGSADLAADAYAIDHSDLHTVAPRHHGSGQSRHAGADDHDIDVLHTLS
jgi:hypothetical protein